MTYREKLKIEHPELVDEDYIGGCFGCPGEYWKGAPNFSTQCKKLGECSKCWDQTIPGTEEEKLAAPSDVDMVRTKTVKSGQK